MKRPTVQYALLGFIFLITATYQVRHVRFVVRYATGQVRAVEDPVDISLGSSVVGSVSKEAETAGVRSGDVLLAVNGRPYRGYADLYRALEDARPGDVLTVAVRHKGGNEQTLRIALRKSNQFASDERAFIILLHLVLPLSSALLGFWVVLIRPRDPLAWLLLALLLGFGQLLVLGGESHDGRLISTLALTYSLFLSQTWVIWLFLLGVYFPSRLALDRRVPWLKWLFLVPLGLVSGAQVAVLEAGLKNYLVFERFPSWSGEVAQVLVLAAIALFFVAIGAKYFLEPTRDGKRRLRLLYVGIFLALTPTLILLLVGGWTHRGLDDFSAWIEVPCLSMALLFPITLAYVIVVQRAMDVRLVIRHGLQYTLARRGVIVVQMLLGSALFIAVAILITSHTLRPVATVGVLAAGIWGIFLLQGGTRRAAVWIDRRFFRDSYDAEQILSELAEQVRTIVETRPLVETVTRRIADALHVPRVAVLLNGSAPYRPAHAVGFDRLPEVEFPESASTVRVLERDKQPLRVYFDDPNSWIYSTEQMNDRERQMLVELRSELLVPLAAKDHLTGFMSLGQKLSEAPYSAGDLRLLKSVAAQTTLALEVARLTAAMGSEIAQRERLRRELEIAKEVQEHLFPQRLPAVPGLDYYGRCESAREVGGDYYDFLERSGGKLGIAIGDVSGKGIGAALMMASLEASLRSQAPVAPSLPELIRRVNELVYEASSVNRYATFFYAEYDPATRRLCYVNAGHNPPVVARNSSGDREVTRLAAGGPVIGLLRNALYEAGCVELAPGDLVVLYTDGVSESMNSADAEWGEESLIESAKTCCELPASEVVTRILSAARAFAAGAPQHDDMTLVVLRVL